MKAITEVDGDIATVRAFSTGGHERLAALLIKAAGPERVREVRGVSTGGRGFRVPVDIAQAAGLVPDPMGDIAFPEPQGTPSAELSPNAQAFMETVSQTAQETPQAATQPEQEAASEAAPESASEPEQDASAATESEDTSEPEPETASEPEAPAAKAPRKSTSRSRAKAADAPAGE
ncbi:hypothetical protein [Nocardia miyunensis]|uniref:hypothetical protein n=1 Tax=Nocardia miyunensis TaxID=282684 RepID=UPI00083352D2|nr:hypothetical protein [Nocardia miyunensis]